MYPQVGHGHGHGRSTAWLDEWYGHGPCTLDKHPAQIWSSESRRNWLQRLRHLRFLSEQGPPSHVLDAWCQSCEHRLKVHGNDFLCSTCAIPIPVSEVWQCASQPSDTVHLIIFCTTCGRRHWGSAGNDTFCTYCGSAIIVAVPADGSRVLLRRASF